MWLKSGKDKIILQLVLKKYINCVIIYLGLKMKKFISFIHSRKLILLCSLLVNISAIVLSAIFLNIYIYIGVCLIATILFLLFANDNLATSNYKLVLSLIFLFLPLVAYAEYGFTKAKRGSKSFRMKWRKINHENADRFEPTVKTIEEMGKVNPEAVKLSKYLVATTNMPLYSKSNCEYFDNSEILLNSISKDIKNAKSSILLEVDSIKDGEAWRNLFEVLKQKAMKGVQITLLYDEKGCLNGFKDKKVFRKLANHGIKTVKFNKLKLFASSFSYCRDKKNLVIIDSEIAYMSTVQFKDEFISNDLPKAKNGDGVKITGDCVWSLVVLFFTYMQLFTKETYKLDDYKKELSAKTKNKSYVQAYGTAPFYKDKLVKTNLLNTIYSAKSSILIITPYLAIDDEVVNALKLCSKNGIEIKLIISDKTEKQWQRAISLANIENLVKDRIRVYQYENNILAKQFVLIDDSVALIGGGNLDFRNLNNNFEMGCLLVNDLETNEKLKSVADTLITNSHLVTIKDLSQTGFFTKFYGRALKFIWPVL